jgi:hypothetical protein
MRVEGMPAVFGEAGKATIQLFRRLDPLPAEDTHNGRRQAAAGESAEAHEVSAIDSRKAWARLLAMIYDVDP